MQRDRQFRTARSTVAMNVLLFGPGQRR